MPQEIMPRNTLLQSLQDVRRRVRLLAIGFGGGLFVTAAVLAILLTVSLDYLLNLPAIPRLILILAALAGLAYLIRRFLVQPLASALPLGEVAGRLERAFPQFQDRLRSSVDILSGRLPGSEPMKTRVVSEATQLASGLDFEQAVVIRPVIYSAASAAVAIVLIALIAASIGPHYRDIAFDRLLRPFGAVAWPKTVKIDLVGNMPNRVAAGDRVEVNIRLARGDRASRTATLLLQYGNADGTSFGPIEKQLMTRGDDGIYHASLDARTFSEKTAGGVMKISVDSGDDQLAIAPIQVVRRLSMTSVLARIIAPPYAKAPPVEVNLAQNPASATVGSVVELKLAFNKPIDQHHPPSFAAITGTVPAGLSWSIDGSQAWVGRWTVADSVQFRLTATDRDGLHNTDAQEYQLIARPDQPPAVQIENPRGSEDRTADSIIPLRILAEDDFGIDALSLDVAKVGTPSKWSLPLVSKGEQTKDVQWTRADDGADLLRFHAAYPWSLSKLAHTKLQPGDVLEYHATVTDNFLLNGNRHAPVQSGKLRITIISQDELNNQVTQTLRDLADQIARIKTAQANTQHETHRLADESKNHPKFDAADTVAANRIATAQSGTAADTKELANKVSAALKRLQENQSTDKELSQTASETARLLNDAAKNPMNDAAAALAKARQADISKSQRNSQLAKAGQRQQAAIDELQKALEKMGSMGSLSKSIEQIKSLLAEQEKVTQQTADAGKNNLGRTPEQMDPKSRKALAEAAAKQADLAKKTSAAIADLQKSADKLSKSDPASAAAMKQAAATATEQNVPQSQSTAAQAAQKNQQGQAQASQKQAEMGLQMMLDNLREAQRRKLAQLAAKLADLQTQIANLIRRQAGHNLDDLSLQNGDAMKKLTATSKVELFTEAQRDISQPVTPADPAALSSGQELTERNTRDIAKSVQALPDSGAAADHLSDAADHMERAAVSLRAAQWAAAYDPPQVQALVSLRAAKKWVDAQKTAAEKKQKQQQRDSVRAVYAKIKAEQDKLNGDTKRLNTVPRLPDGSLKRSDAIAIAELAGRQGKLADRVQKLDSDLSALGSIVYIWANKDIATSMLNVKDDLGKPETDQPVQSQQARIDQQLKAMIDDLITKPIQSKFAQKGGGGGGGGGGGSGLPSETELRLMKDLQKALNNDTKSLANSGNKNKPAMAALGNRQGELRNLLAELLNKSSHGKLKIGPEPDNRNLLPEEAKADSVENQELDNSLLTGKPGAQPVQNDVGLVGQRMARSRQRLAINDDDGKITQLIQQKIVSNLDDLIQMSRKKLAQSQSPPPPPKGGGEKMARAQPNSGAKPQNSSPKSGVQSASCNHPAQGENARHPGNEAADTSTPIRQSAREWGAISPRTRQAVIDGASEQPIDKYKKLVDDYYKSLATKANTQ